MCGVGVGCGDLRVQCWNVNSMMKSDKSWVKFVNKMKNSNENVFIIIDSRFETEQEIEFRKLWDGPIFFNSHSSIQRGIIVLINPIRTGIFSRRQVPGGGQICPPKYFYLKGNFWPFQFFPPKE